MNINRDSEPVIEKKNTCKRAYALLTTSWQKVIYRNYKIYCNKKLDRFLTILFIFKETDLQTTQQVLKKITVDLQNARKNETLAKNQLSALEGSKKTLDTMSTEMNQMQEKFQALERKNQELDRMIKSLNQELISASQRETNAYLEREVNS